MALTKITGEGVGAVDDLTVDTNTLVVDAANNRVGVGVSSPQSLTHFKGTSSGQNILHLDNSAGSAHGDTNNNVRVVSGNNGYWANLVIAGHSLEFKVQGGSTGITADSSGRFGVSKTPDSSIGTVGFEASAAGQILMTTSGADVLFVNRKSNDGSLIRLFQDGTEEGSISVSGTTVSYNGGHLARFSQATDGNRIDGLVKGTVMTNLDQMAVWHHEAQAATYYTEDDELPDGVSVGDEKTPAVAAYDEENEQLNCMAVSSVEGDANVAGVFVNWDDDDTDFTSDMNIAMTGDMVIRIASGTTVARGDLLMSAGDGTAKPQGDDIVRSKTIAKVTSTTKSHTYDDGTYLVPCVLMAC